MPSVALYCHFIYPFIDTTGVLFGGVDLLLVRRIL
jgi:hypothetical protein